MRSLLPFLLLVLLPFSAKAEPCGRFIKPDDCREVQNIASAPEGYQLKLVDAPYGIPGGRVIPNAAYLVFEEVTPHTPPRSISISYEKKEGRWKRGAESNRSGDAALDGIPFELAERLHAFLLQETKLVEDFRIERMEVNKNGRRIAKKDPSVTARYVILLKKNESTGMPIERQILVDERDGKFILVEESTYPGAIS